MESCLKGNTFSLVVAHLQLDDVLALRCTSRQMLAYVGNTEIGQLIAALLAVVGDLALSPKKAYAIWNECGAEMTQRKLSSRHDIRVCRSIDFTVGFAHISFLRLDVNSRYILECFSRGVGSAGSLMIHAQLADGTVLPVYKSADSSGAGGFCHIDVIDVCKEVFDTLSICFDDRLPNTPPANFVKACGASFDTVPFAAKDDFRCLMGRVPSSSLSLIYARFFPRMLSASYERVVRQDLALSRFTDQFVDDWLNACKIISRACAVEYNYFDEHWEMNAIIEIFDGDQLVTVDISLFFSQTKGWLYDGIAPLNISVNSVPWIECNSGDIELDMNQLKIPTFPIALDIFQGLQPREIYGLVMVSARSAAFILSASDSGLCYNAFDWPIESCSDALNVASFLGSGPEDPFGDPFPLSIECDSEDNCEEDQEYEYLDGPVAMDLDLLGEEAETDDFPFISMQKLLEVRQATLLRGNYY